MVKSDEIITITPNAADLRGTGLIRWQPIVGEEATAVVSEKLPGSEGDAVLDAAVRILGRGLSPLQTNGRIAGLVVGHIQSGKTLSFTTVAALARDNNFQLVIVIAGTSNPLLAQSTQRLHSDLHVKHIAGSWKWSTYTNLVNDEKTRRSIRQELEEWQDPDVPMSECPTVLITVMKNHRHLENLSSLLLQLDLTEVPALIIDDEADQASLNTLVKRSRQSTTYRRIGELRDSVQAHTFLQYTATPQATLLISIIDGLSPEFVEVIEPGGGYVGGRDFFAHTPNHLTRVIPDQDILSDHNPLQYPPESLLEALRIFLTGVAAGLVKGRSTENSRRSMLVHPSQKTAQHREFYQWISAAFNEWQEILRLPESEPDRIDLLSDFRDAYDNLALTVSDLPSFEDIKRSLPRAFRNTTFEEVNAKSGKTPEVDWNRKYGWILIGGQAMDRGFTVEGLTVTYMPRGTGVGNADVIQQRGRFFGYKRSYLGYCRIYLEQDVLNAFQQYIAHEEGMRESLKEFSKTDEPLKEWKRNFILSPDLKPCRDNVIEYGYVRGAYSDDWFFTQMQGSEDEVEWHRYIVDEFSSNLNFSGDESYISNEPAQQHLVCRDVPLESLLTDLLIPWWDFSSGEHAEEITGLLMQVSKALEQDGGETAVVYRMRPQFQSRRGVYANGRIRQVFQGPTRMPGSSAERYSYPGDREFLDRSRVSVQIHYFNLNRNKVPIAHNRPVIAIWVPKRMHLNWLVQNQSS